MIREKKMNESLIRVGNCLKVLLFLIHIGIICHSCINFINERKNVKNDYVETNCQIIETIREKVNCSGKMKLCEKSSYIISYGKNRYSHIDRLPSWFSRDDKENLYGYPKLFQGDIVLRGMNLSCFSSQSDIQWSKPNSNKFLWSISFALFILVLIVVDCFKNK